MSLNEIIQAVVNNEATVELLLTLGVIGFGSLTKKYHGTYKEVKGLITTLAKAMEDDELTKAEVKEIVDEAKDIVE